MIIGLTGGIASGKSTVSKYLAEKGFKVYDADWRINELQKIFNFIFKYIYINSL